MSRLSRIRLAALGVSLTVMGAIAWVGAAPARAQSTTVDPLEDFRSTDDSSNPFEASGGNAQNSIFDLIHQMQLQNGGSITDFNRRRQENIRDQAEAFRTLQRQQIESSVQNDVSTVEDDTQSEL